MSAKRGLKEPLQKKVETLELMSKLAIKVAEYYDSFPEPFLRVGPFKVTYHAIRRYVERALGKKFIRNFKEFILEARAREVQYSSNEYKKGQYTFYELGTYILIFAKDDILVTIVDKASPKKDK